MKKTLFAGIAVVSLLATTSAFAVDLTQPLKTIAGNDFVDQNNKPIDLTPETVITNSLFGEQTQNEGDKKSNYLLAVDIHAHAKDFTFTPDQVVTVRKALAATQPTAVFGQVMSLIDPTFAKPSK